MNRSRRGLCAAPALLFATGAGAQQKPLVLPLKWYLVQIDDGAFTVELPGIPDHRLVNDTTQLGAAFVLHSYSVEAGGYSYLVQTALYPTGADAAQPRRLIQTALDDRAKVLEGGKWSKVDWRDVAGATAVESWGPLKGGNALRQLVLLKGRRFVSLAFMGPAASIAGAEAERFFKSLKLKS